MELIDRLSITVPEPSTEGEQALVVGLLRSLSVFRAITLLWAIVGVSLSTDHLESPTGAVALLVAMTVTTGLVTLWPRRGSILPVTARQTILFELVVGVIVLVGDGLVYDDSRPQSLPWSWPATAVMAAGIIFGKRAGFVSAAVIGAASLVSEVGLLGRDSGAVAAFSKLGLWLLAGGIAGYVTSRLRLAESQISVARAREEVSRQLHDGVLQTLAVIQRRSTDTELAAIARDQEHELRGYLSTSVDEPTAFEPEIRRLAARHESMFGGKVVVVVALDFPTLDAASSSALTGAIGEALTNAGKHGEAQKVTIYAEPADGAADDAEVFVSVKDDGSGFDPAQAEERIGISRSIRGRMHDAGGRVELSSQQGRGTEVRLWI